MADAPQPVPARAQTDFRLVVHVLATAIEEADSGPVKEAVATAARRLGEQVGQDVRAHLQPGAGVEQQLEAVEEVLSAHGFQPYREGERVLLANCPFHALAQDHMVLVCGSNLAFVDGLVVGLATADVEAWLEPQRGRCCVIVGQAGTEPEYRGG